MADNTQINNGTGDVIRDIDRTQNIPPGTSKTQIVQLDAGGEQAESLVTQLNPLPTADVNFPKTQSSDSPQFVAITGDPDGDFAGVNLLEQAMDTSSGLGLNVNLTSGIKVDQSKAIVLSDGLVFPLLMTSPSSALFFDCAGYQSGSITPTGNTASLFGSNDGINFSPMLLATLASNTGPASATTGSTFSFPISFKILKITFSGLVGSAVLVLKQGAFSPAQPSVNLQQITGSNVASGGIGGSLGVGGATSNANPNLSNPVTVGGVDTSSLTRRFTCDTTGRLAINANSVTALGTATPFGLVPAVSTAQNVAPLAVVEQGQVEGQSRDEILTQILLELRIANQQNYEFQRELIAAVYSLQTATSYKPVFDAPETLRADPSLFVQ